MFNAKPCPNCGNLLPIYYPPQGFLVAGLFTGELLFWLAIMLLLAWLWSPPGSGGFLGALGSVALVGWFFARSDQRRERQAAGAHGWYLCPRCHHHYEDDGGPLSTH